MSKGLKEIPFGWIMNPDGSYSKPKRFGTSAMDIRNDSASSCSLAREIRTSPTKKRIRQNPKPLLNKLEVEYLQFLKEKLPKFLTDKIRPQAKRYKLGNGIWYKPDFTVSVSRIELETGAIVGTETAWEVKGPHAFRGGLENLKVAAHQWPEITFILAWKENGQWVEQRVLP